MTPQRRGASCSSWFIVASRPMFLPDAGRRPIGIALGSVVTVARMSDKLLVERRGEVELITINRPEMRNALDFETYDLLEQAVRATTARCLVITGTHPAFCSGDDVRAV